MKKLENPETNFVKLKCRCGHVVSFLKACPRKCSNCGRLVIPTRKNDFIENVLKAKEKNERNDDVLTQ